MYWKELEPTDKQLRFIRKIERVVKVKFTGKTRGDASDYISKHKNWYFMKINMASEFRFLSRQLGQMLSYVDVNNPHDEYAGYPSYFIDDVLN